MLGFFGPLYEHIVAALRKQQGQLAFDRIDQMNSWFTPIVLVGLTFAISCKQYFGQPLKCWTPREFSGSWDGYVHDYCFIEDTYFVPNGTEITDQAREGHHINYYRWVPLVLLMQAALFVLPYSIWNISHKKTVINLKASLRFFESSLKNQKPIEACESLATELWLKLTKIREEKRAFGSIQATINFFLLKLGFVINCVFQMVILKYFLDVEDYFWGFVHLFKVEFRGTSEHEDSIFPRVVLCDFKVRNLGQQHKHTVPCIMILNVIVEKLYICLYFWLIFVFVVTSASMVHFAFQMIFRKHSLIPTNLNTKRNMNPTRSHDFIKKYLHADGVLLLTYFDAQFGAYRTSQLIDCLLDRFLSEQNHPSSASTSLHEESSPVRYVAFNTDTIPISKYRQMRHSTIDEVDAPSAPPAEEKEKEKSL